MLAVVPDGCPGHEGEKDRPPSLTDEIVREGARRLVVRNGYHESRWRAVNAPHLVALSRAGAAFCDGVLAERPDSPRGGSRDCRLAGRDPGR